MKLKKKIKILQFISMYSKEVALNKSRMNEKCIAKEEIGKKKKINYEYK